MTMTGPTKRNVKIHVYAKVYSVETPSIDDCEAFQIPENKIDDWFKELCVTVPGIDDYIEGHGGFKVTVLEDKDNPPNVLEQILAITKKYLRKTY
jgi:hypothetical protein